MGSVAGEATLRRVMSSIASASRKPGTEIGIEIATAVVDLGKSATRLGKACARGNLLPDERLGLRKQECAQSD
jgi:hypothetical protein